MSTLNPSRKANRDKRNAQLRRLKDIVDNRGLALVDGQIYRTRNNKFACRVAWSIQFARFVCIAYRFMQEKDNVTGANKPDVVTWNDRGKCIGASFAEEFHREFDLVTLFVEQDIKTWKGKDRTDNG